MAFYNLRRIPNICGFVAWWCSRLASNESAAEYCYALVGMDTAIYPAYAARIIRKRGVILPEIASSNYPAHAAKSDSNEQPSPLNFSRKELAHAPMDAGVVHGLGLGFRAVRRPPAGPHPCTDAGITSQSGTATPAARPGNARGHHPRDGTPRFGRRGLLGLWPADQIWQRHCQALQQTAPRSGLLAMRNLCVRVALDHGRVPRLLWRASVRAGASHSSGWPIGDRNSFHTRNCGGAMSGILIAPPRF